MRRATVAALVLLAPAGLALANCRRQAAPAAAGPNVVTFAATDFAFSGPDTVPAGLTTVALVNRGPSLHHLQLLKLDSGRTYDSLMAILRIPGPPPAWLGLWGGPTPWPRATRFKRP